MGVKWPALKVCPCRMRHCNSHVGEGGMVVRGRRSVLKELVERVLHSMFSVQQVSVRHPSTIMQTIIAYNKVATNRPLQTNVTFSTHEKQPDNIVHGYWSKFKISDTSGKRVEEANRRDVKDFHLARNLLVNFHCDSPASLEQRSRSRPFAPRYSPLE
ncbi:hypothetical protein RRG08_048371 [Elysia crispata]|uniref:Uncharacterized protein n=1 Tax=Elysia crispata TaxID=231223 RepID=A0AAE1B995_9GAST|nr:hypothetical protein RRG08_048371 [Elysia crispata]